MRKRESWMDVLRIVSAFLVIVNHTNSDLFKASSPEQTVWWLSIVWYYISKIAVPMFVLLSGACLLGKQDSLCKAFKRFGRALAVLLLFSYAYYLHDAWVYWGLWPRMIDMSTFLPMVWTGSITDGFWYLYFYLGLMLLLPLLQRLNLSKRGQRYLIALCFLWDAVLPLIGHYVPALSLPKHLQAPLCTGYLGLLYSGQWLRTRYVPTPKRTVLVAGILIACIALSAALTRMEFERTDGAAYWFMDDRLHPSLPIIAAALSAAALVKGLCQKENLRLATELGSCAFGIYLLQDWVIVQSETRLYVPIASILPTFPAMLVWEIVVFLLCLSAAWVMRRIPGLKRIV